MQFANAQQEAKATATALLMVRGDDGRNHPIGVESATRLLAGLKTAYAGQSATDIEISAVQLAAEGCALSKWDNTGFKTVNRDGVTHYVVPFGFQESTGENAVVAQLTRLTSKKFQEQLATAIAERAAERRR